MTEQEIKEIAADYKQLKTFLKVDRDLQKKGIWGFIASDQLGDVLQFVRLFEQKVLGVNND
tara:strand:+ start:163 stop:345 length:183 start_codon:yes stop_codon:yes gene_type:complete